MNPELLSLCPEVLLTHDHSGDVKYVQLLKCCWYCGGLNCPEARKCEHCGAHRFEAEGPPVGVLTLAERSELVNRRFFEETVLSYY